MNALQKMLYWDDGESGMYRSGDGTPYSILVDDYVRYHAVFAVLGSLTALALFVFGIYGWLQFRCQRQWNFEKRSYLGFALVGTLTSALLFVVSAANAYHPRAGGFRNAVAQLNVPSREQLYNDTYAWMSAQNTPFPVQEKIEHRLVWQRPKAAVCSVLLLICLIWSTRLWKALLIPNAVRLSRHIVLAIANIPTILLLLIMAIANTQASVAPIMLTLLMG